MYYSKRYIAIHPHQNTPPLNSFIPSFLPLSEAVMEVLFHVFMRNDLKKDEWVECYLVEKQACKNITLCPYLLYVLALAS